MRKAKHAASLHLPSDRISDPPIVDIFADKLKFGQPPKQADTPASFQGPTDRILLSTYIAAAMMH
jgi:hypothetical protein